MATMPPSPPEPLSLMQVKLNLRVDNETDDTLIEDLIVAAREHVENMTGLILVPRVVTETADQLGRWIDLFSWPIAKVMAVRYPAAGIMTPLVSSAWQVSLARRPVRLLPAVVGWGVGSYAGGLCGAPGLPVEIDVQAGFATPPAVPVAIRHAMHLLIGHWYSNRAAAEVGARAAAIEIPQGVDSLLQRFKMARI